MSVDRAVQFVQPGRSRGLLEVLHRRYLTSLLVHKELRARYRGSILGMLWSYAKPATQFLVFYFAIGVFLGMNKAIDNYVVYMFAGIVVMNYFSETFGNDTRSVVGNASLVNKIYLPRELFPVSSLWVAFVHFVPQLVILLLGALLFQWRPTWLGILAILVGFLIASILGLGLGLIGAATNVFYRDAENFVDLLLMVVTWISPVMYTWSQVHAVLAVHWGGLLWYLYQLNPLTPAVELFHYGFWVPTLGADSPTLPIAVPQHLVVWAGAAMVTSCVTLVIGEVLFRRLDPRFAQEL